MKKLYYILLVLGFLGCTRFSTSPPNIKKVQEKQCDLPDDIILADRKLKFFYVSKNEYKLKVVENSDSAEFVLEKYLFYCDIVYRHGIEVVWSNQSVLCLDRCIHCEPEWSIYLREENFSKEHVIYDGVVFDSISNNYAFFDRVKGMMKIANTNNFEPFLEKEVEDPECQDIFLCIDSVSIGANHFFLRYKGLEPKEIMQLNW
ncbi:hypothetical protein [Saprospira grandis]|uniref:hypothetical protein n=1 Tax=Saprospira grandis TaxID=1008 RepID=UPI0022DDE2DC|nr:hypothetical protein [Saprospira grandis]WBM73995.1 hypothetical protein OP864_13465 [Saprospira grandis]